MLMRTHWLVKPVLVEAVNYFKKYMNWRKQKQYRMDTTLEDTTTTTMAVPLIINTSAPEQMASASIRVVENKIFFYDAITDDSVIDLNRILLEIDIKLQNTTILLGDSFDPIIHLHLKTGGGEIYCAVSTVDLIRTLKSKVYTYVDGSVASAGTLITLVGQRRFMGKYSNLLIHQLSAEMYGTYSDMEDTMENCTNMMKFIKTFYKQYTKIPMKKLDELLKKNLWLSSEECLEYGIIDEIL